MPDLGSLASVGQAHTHLPFQIPTPVGFVVTAIRKWHVITGAKRYQNIHTFTDNCPKIISLLHAHM